jgi:dephospho-CoA kinase
MKVIGLTGGIGSGKSRFVQYLAEFGAAVIDADRLGHEVLKSTQVREELVAAFGREILNLDGEIDRGRLAGVVFNDEAALRKLNRITHPKIFQMVRAQLEAEKQKGTEVAVIEAPLLIEAGWLELIDEVWVVTASETTVSDRLKERGGLSESQARARIGAQASDAERLGHADVIINNDGSPDELKETARRLWERLSAT